MSENLTSLVQSLHHQSNGGATSGPALRTDRGYQDALQAYWRGDFVGAATGAAGRLEGEPDGESRFAAYRLWVEALAEQRDTASLRALAHHLYLRGQAEPDDQSTYMALRGLVHLEIDEPNAARLMAKAVRDQVADPYALELAQRVDRRFGEDVEVPALARCTSAVADYFHWQELARALLCAGPDAKEALNETLQHVRSAFRGSPLPQLFEFHQSVERGFFAGAALVAQRLVELFPHSVDYRYYHAYAMFEDGDYPGARRLLHGLVSETGETDPEIVGLLGHCHAKLGEPEKAKHCLQTAVALLKADGLPSSHVRLELANVEDELRGDQLDPALEMPRQTRMWLVNLSPRRYHELQTSSESSIDRLLRPMGAEPRMGDFCFFAAPDAPDDKGLAQWRVVAIYSVDSEPLWHPTYRHHTALKLVTRLPEGIPVDVQVADGDAGREAARATLGKDHPLAYGVYELEMGALDVITEAVRRHNEGNRERRADGGRSRRTTG